MPLDARLRRRRSNTSRRRKWATTEELEEEAHVARAAEEQVKDWAQWDADIAAARRRLLE
jgi:hypothetical protein